jgi:YHS domain-containing protein
MFSVFIREFLLPLLFFLFLRSVLRSLFAGFRKRTPRTGPPPAANPARTGGTLHKDPVCGTYVSDDSAIAQVVGGQTVYFCSPECRDTYVAPVGNRRPAGSPPTGS